MPCYSPLNAFQSRKLNATGKRSTVFSIKTAKRNSGFKLPCGKCIGCRLKTSRDFAIRAVQESSLYERNCFITLTYSPKHLPKNGSINPIHPQKFMKRLREYFGPGIRSFGCAEYGEKFARPHYHICLLNFDFPDKELWRKKNGFPLYNSKSLKRLWPYGHATIAEFNFETAAYVARYVTKKISGPEAPSHYKDKLPERSVCRSLKPGIGKPWLDRYMSDVFPSGQVVLNGKLLPTPRYYNLKFEIAFPSEYLIFKERRKKAALELADRTRETLSDLKRRSQAKGLQVQQQLKRKFENGS